MDSLKENTPDVGLLASVEEGIANLPEGSETKRYLQSLLNDSNYDTIGEIQNTAGGLVQ